MAYTHFVEINSGRRASVDQKYQRTYERVFMVRTSSPSYGPYYAASHPSLPAIWSVHPEDSNAYCTGINPENDSTDARLWKISCSYSYAIDSSPTGGPSGATGNPAIDTQQQGLPPGDRVQNPLLRPRDYSMSGTTSTIAVWQDIYGNAIANSAEDPLLPAQEIEVGGAVINVGLNATSSPSGTWIAAQKKLNATTFTVGPYVCAAGSVRLNNINASIQYENSVSYWRWQLAFEYRPNGWSIENMDVGKREFVGGKYRTISENGVPVSSPVPLSGGARLPHGSSPVYLTFHVIPRVVFPSL